MGRAPCCDKANVKKGPWSPEEDAKLKEFIENFGTGGNWIALPQKAGLKRCGKSCRLRWLNYLRPNIRHGEFSDDEDRIICSLYATIGSRWSVIAAQLPGRTDNDIKNYWNTKLKKKLLTMFPSLQEKQTFFPSMSTFQPSLPLQYDHNIISSSQFLNMSTFNNTFSSPNFMNNVDNNNNTSNTSLLVHDDHVNVINDLISSPQSTSSHLKSLMTNNNIGVSIDHNNSYNLLGCQMQEQYHTSLSPMKEGMVMFGSTSCSSSEGGSYNKDLHQNQQYEIKLENNDITTLHDHTHTTPSAFMIKNHNIGPSLNNDHLGQLNFNSYLLNDGDETKTTHYQKGMCSYYY